jgi:tetratricopeptide (TPR) repeat protein
MAQADQRHRCARCRAWLARDHADRLCSPCQKAGPERLAAPPDVPIEFWYDGELQAALVSQHMGRVIRAYRHHPHHGSRGLTQDDVASWAGIAQGRLSSIETGPSINRIDRLVFWAQLLAIPEQHLWFRLPDGNATGRPWPAYLLALGAPAVTAHHGVSWSTSAGLETMVASAADTSLSFITGATETNVTDAMLDDLRWEIGRIAVDYVHAPLTTLLQDLIVVRDVLFGLLQKRQAPRHSRDLYLLAGTSCALLANASHNVGDLRAALVQVRAAFTCADLAGHNGLRAWSRGTAAVITEWSLRPAKAVELAAQGAVFASSHESRARLAAIEARAAARTADHARALAAVRRLQDVADDHSETHDDVTALGGVLSFPLAKQQFYLGSTYGLLGDHDAAERHALAAIEAYEAGPSTDRSYGDEALARVDLANARLAVHDVGGAQDALAPVLSLPRDRRIRQLDAAIGRTRAILEQPPLARARAGQELLVSITDEYEAHAAPPAPLHRGADDVG